MSEYDIEPVDNPPDFSYEKGSDEEQKYVLGYLILLEQFYDKYKHKSVDYILDNIDNDTKQLEKDIIDRTDELNTFFDNARDEELKNAGIVEGKIKDTGISSVEISDLKEEQKYTAMSIVAMLALGIKAKASRSKYRNTTGMFSIDSNLRTAVSRTQNMGSVGFRDTLAVARNKALIFLFGDPLMDWVTAGDSKVCSYCRAIEADSPMPLSKMPIGPLHPHCGERCERKLHDEENNPLTTAALALTFY